MVKEQIIALSTTYFGPVWYYTKLLLPGKVVLEKQENYQKQSYRNRLIICGANGPLSLVVPVKLGSFHKVKIADLEIDYRTRWQDVHQLSVESAYRSAPFFEYYIDEIRPWFRKKPKYLFDLNLEILQAMIRMLGIPGEISVTSDFRKDYGAWDFRYSIHPKKSVVDPAFHPAIYTQVFSSRYGFIPNASILDLLLNTGPDAREILARSLLYPGKSGP